jgi:hypothetical protein
MKRLMIAGSILGLALTIVPSCLVFARVMSWQTNANLMTAGMIIWFITAPFWMKKN